MDKNSKDNQSSIFPRLMNTEELDHMFSDVRGHEPMEELMAAVKEYITEKTNGNDAKRNKKYA